MHSFILLLWLVLCAVQDARQRRIANLLTLGAAALALVYLLVTGNTWLGAEAGQGGWAVLIALALTLPGFFMGRMGAGDVKLMTALGLATDGLFILEVFIGAGIVSVIWLLLAPRLWLHMSQRVRDRLENLRPDASKKLPFAPFVLVAAIPMLYWIH
ncbi:prepilin peptidase [Pseudomonas granadensis]|uniref:Prepilin peptidase n=1 Tax=Pseudomonas granadensis TaxID=1421430 RepID=A0ABX7GI27_9PSED|nr:prepilin peptidase [Pseudomonas granadensis]MBN6775884.1 prepilin peptidase [Pseudomonas granadensis]MBN6804060.1 prepilin peptidase [Pseudomonas granadensis]MBN6830739.1 prepilin peptidase [Pseudomonas granadensis]MBN6838281.1 prepilin peptidase [Pseudomonas granadensis]MBN6867643.1 prepilin peptidase [Pseudomonas granadensis]